MNRIEGEKNRFAIYVDDVYAGKMTFEKQGDNSIVIEHTVVEKEFEGRGLAKELYLFVVDYARKEGLKIVPVCPYVKASFQKNPDHSDVLAK